MGAVPQPATPATSKRVHRRTIDHLPVSHWYDRANKRVALFTTKVVGTMWCAYFFAVFDCLALPTALTQGLYGIVQWVASFFLQLVLLSVIMVGQNLQSLAADARAEKTFQDTEKIIALNTALDQKIENLGVHLANLVQLEAGNHDHRQRRHSRS